MAVLVEQVGSILVAAVAAVVERAKPVVAVVAVAAVVERAKPVAAVAVVVERAKPVVAVAAVVEVEDFESLLLLA